MYAQDATPGTVIVYRNSVATINTIDIVTSFTTMYLFTLDTGRTVRYNAGEQVEIAAEQPYTQEELKGMESCQP